MQSGNIYRAKTNPIIQSGITIEFARIYQMTMHRVTEKQRTPIRLLNTANFEKRKEKIAGVYFFLRFEVRNQRKADNIGDLEVL